MLFVFLLFLTNRPLMCLCDPLEGRYQDEESVGNLLMNVEVSQYAFAGASATLTCSYDLRQTQLYSLKWYHNKTEIYRYVPTERPEPVIIKPTYSFRLHEVFRNGWRLTLNLTDLRISASGTYSCEVIAEHPSFRTERKSAKMTILDGPLSPPIIVGAAEIYEADDIIRLRCQPTNWMSQFPRPSIKWYLSDQMIGPENSLEDNSGLNLTLPAEQILEAGGSQVAECRLVLGSHQLTTSRILRVKRRHVFMKDYLSEGCTSLPGVLCIVTLAFVFLEH